ncbi:hypothetical protein NEIMUCOT_03597 [Neisseria mucosa ATCC 25996]|uniref:Uncharacterized protein n=1 Tax=Neisseria mucosa (strain ATCC 25996 / DSM 4631 / NCTC 10774 / M26) TaxID=546266 RepID=D2ZSL4_NEIM2|nr:hypothetical protein NEIMUCOT_03597 [Neisseria mucosa ATCC 25996]
MHNCFSFRIKCVSNHSNRVFRRPELLKGSSENRFKHYFWQFGQ